MPLVIPARLLHCGRGRNRHLTWRRGTQPEAHDDHDGALHEPEPEEGGLIAARLNHIGDRNDGERRASAETGSGEPRRETTTVGEPFQRIADRAAVDHAGPDAANRSGEIQQCQ